MIIEQWTKRENIFYLKDLISVLNKMTKFELLIACSYWTVDRRRKVNTRHLAGDSTGQKTYVHSSTRIRLSLSISIFRQHCKLYEFNWSFFRSLAFKKPFRIDLKVFLCWKLSIKSFFGPVNFAFLLYSRYSSYST